MTILFQKWGSVGKPASLPEWSVSSVIDLVVGEPAFLPGTTEIIDRLGVERYTDKVQSRAKEGGEQSY